MKIIYVLNEFRLHACMNIIHRLNQLSSMVKSIDWDGYGSVGMGRRFDQNGNRRIHPGKNAPASGYFRQFPNGLEDAQFT